MREVPRKTRAIRSTLLDRAIGYLAPVWGARRYQARVMQAMAQSYIGASKSRRSMAGWLTRGGSADADTLMELPELRNRSRDLARNAPIATGALNTVVTKVVGTGLALQSRVRRDVLGLTEEEASNWQRETEMEFALWAESSECDLTRHQNFYGLQELAFRSTLESGDLLVLLPFVKRPASPYGIKLQLIEADRITNKDSVRDTPRLAGGVEMDADGAPIAYHILKQHPGGIDRLATEWDIVPAYGAQTGRRNAIHLYRRLRPGQTRGVPYLAPVIEPLKQLDRYTEAEIMAAVVSGMFSVFIKTEGDGLSPLESAVSGMAPAGSDRLESNWDGKLSSGLVAELKPGEDIVSANPGRPNAAFDPFCTAVLRQIGVALELPYEVLIKHFTSSYSAARAALLEAWAMFRCRRDWLANYLCQPIYETWMEEAVARGRIEAPGFLDDPLLRHAWLGSQWVGDGPGAIDPLKEVEAARSRLEIGVSTLAEETMLHDGGDWELKHAQQVKEHQLREAGGLIELPAPAAPDKPEEDKEEEAARQMLAGLAEGQLRIAQYLEHQPAPVVRVDVPQPVVNVQPAAVNVDVKPPDIRIEAPVVHVAQPKPKRRIEKIPVRDERGFIVKIIERELSDEVIEKVPVRDQHGFITKIIEREAADDTTRPD